MNRDFPKLDIDTFPASTMNEPEETAFETPLDIAINPPDSTPKPEIIDTDTEPP